MKTIGTLLLLFVTSVPCITLADTNSSETTEPVTKEADTTNAKSNDETIKADADDRAATLLLLQKEVDSAAEGTSAVKPLDESESPAEEKHTSHSTMSSKPSDENENKNELNSEEDEPDEDDC